MFSVGPCTLLQRTPFILLGLHAVCPVAERAGRARDTGSLTRAAVAVLSAMSEQAIQSNAATDDRVAFKRRYRQLAHEQAERAFLENLQKEERDREATKRKAAAEEALAETLAQLEMESTREEKFRQQIRATAPELRELEAKLRAGYTSKELQQQITTRREATSRDAIAMRETAREMQLAAEEAEEDEKRAAIRAREKQESYSRDLDNQLAEEDDRRREAMEQYLREKAAIDEIVLKIAEEDAETARASLAKKQATRAEQDAFETERALYKQRLVEQMAAEDAIIKRQAEEAAARESSQKQAKRDAQDALESLQRRMGEDARRRREEAEELENVRQELYEEEMRARIEAQAQAEAEKQSRMREDMMRDREEYLELTAQRTQREEAEELEFRKAMMEKFARDDRLEQMSAQKRRMKAQEHRRAIEALIEERRARVAHEAEVARKEYEEQKMREAIRADIVEQERQRMLREHAVKLLGYLPKGVINGETDLELLGDDFKETYKSTRPADDW